MKEAKNLMPTKGQVVLCNLFLHYFASVAKTCMHSMQQVFMC